MNFNYFYDVFKNVILLVFSKINVSQLAEHLGFLGYFEAVEIL